MSSNKDKNINLRCETELFESYYKLCIENGTTISAELRGLMTHSVKSGKIIDTVVKVVNTGDFRDTLGGNFHNIPGNW